MPADDIIIVIDIQDRRIPADRTGEELFFVWEMAVADGAGIPEQVWNVRFFLPGKDGHHQSPLTAK